MDIFVIFGVSWGVFVGRFLGVNCVFEGDDVIGGFGGLVDELL